MQYVWQRLRGLFLARPILVALGILAAIAVILAATLFPPGADELAPLLKGTGPSVRHFETVLRERGVRAEVRRDGLYVHPADHDRALMQLASDGDREIFESVFRSGWMETAREKDLRWQLALQKRLEVLISSLDSVREARVQITPASESTVLAGRAGTPARASVVVTLAPGRERLTSAEVRGIANLVSAAVRGLRPEDVAILDRSGQMYSPGPEPPQWADLDDRRLYEMQYERRLEEKIRRILAAEYPNVAVSAFVRLSGRSTEIRETKREVRAVGPQKGPGLIPLSDGGIKGAHGLEEDGRPGFAAQEREIERVETGGPGELEDARVAVSVPIENADPPPGLAQRLREVIHNATGLDLSSISVTCFRLASSTPTSAGAFPWPAAAAPAALLAALAWFVGRRGRRRAVARTGEPPQDLRDFVRRRMAANPALAVHVLRRLGPEKAALVVSVLDEVTAGRVLLQLPPDFLARCTVSASRRDPASQEVLPNALSLCAKALAVRGQGP